MKRTGISIMVALSVLAVGCAGGDGITSALEGPGMPSVEQQRVHDAWRVDMIVGSLHYYDMLAEYSYDDAGRLVKANLAEHNSWQNTSTRFEERFEWENDLMTRQLTHRRYNGGGSREDYEQDFETLYLYDPEGRLLHTGADDNWHGERSYEYDSDGRLIQTYRYEWEGMTYSDRLEWDDRGNVVKRILGRPQLDSDTGLGFGFPLPGTYKETVFEYEYDNHPKPNFGLGASFFWDGRYNPWPFSGDGGDELVRTLSKNNLTRCEAAGLAYRYTYNDEGLPETVEIVWIGTRGTAYIEPGPMTQTIHYKRISE